MPLLRREDYKVGWVCALPVELAAAQEMLDEEHETPQINTHDTNIYTCGRVGGHNVVMACLPEGQPGTHSAVAVAVQMKSTFTSTRFGLMVGIGGGVPKEDSEEIDVRLGDVVISKPQQKHGGVVQYDSGKATPSGFERTGSLNTPPTILLNAVTNLRAKHMRRRSNLLDYLSRLDHLTHFRREAAGLDVLFKAEYNHAGGTTCEKCNEDYLVCPKPRNQKVMIHYGTIASGNQVIRSGTERDRVSAELGGVLCFEMEAAGLMNSFPCLVIRGICDYADSHKNKRWQAYAAGTASACAKEVLSLIPSTDIAKSLTVKETIRGESVEWGEEERKCMQSLRTSNYGQFKDRNPKRVEGTCQWVLHHPNFQCWKETSASSLLWISGDPGCGKSTLSKSLIDEDLKQTDTQTTCYFFFKDDNDVQKSPATAISALLHQLFLRNPMLIKYAMSHFVANGDNLPQLFHILWEILIKAVADPNAGRVFCILDALDECAEIGRYETINALNTFYQQANSTSQLKICVTSRPYQDIERRFTNLTSSFPTIRLHGELEQNVISDEINYVIQSKVCELGSELALDDLEQSKLKTELVKKAPHRTYLWLTLIFDIIRTISIPTSQNLEAAIRTIPSSVDNAYEAILARIKEQDKPKARKLLHIIVSATQPLTLIEMNIALALEDHHRSYTDLDLDNEARFEASVKNICGLFVTVVDRKVYLIHQTAKEFLIATSNDCNTIGWKQSLSLADSEMLMARLCLTYLSLAEMDRALDHTSTTGAYGYLHYAAGFWVSHFREAQKSATEQMLQSALRLCDPLSQRFVTWFDIYSDLSYIRPRPLFTNSLQVGSYFGHAIIVKMLLKRQSDISSKDGLYGKTPLSWAAENGYEAVVKLLLEGGANVDSKDNYGQTPLWQAASSGYETVVKLLLEGGANVDPENYDGKTPLWQAASNGHEAVVKLLLEGGANVDSKEEFGLAPLWQAAYNGHEIVVKLLLEGGVNVGSKDKYGQTPLSWAAENGHEAIVKLLLEGGANVDPENNDGQTPLWQAASNGHKAVVMLLLEGGANVNLKDKYGLTPVWRAASSGHEIVAKLLLEGGADVNSKDKYGQTPLWRAASNGHEAVVKLLLEGGANVDSKEKYGQTPLSWAAKNGHEAVVKRLLERGADVDAENYHGKTPLWWSASSGHEAVVKLLLEGGANVDSKDKYGQTPLWWAVFNRHETIVKLLLEGGANVNSKDQYGRTLLWQAAFNRHDTVVKLLLEGGTDVDSKNHVGQTLLLRAASSGHKAVVKLLLEGGANVNSKDQYGRTPLLQAAFNRHETIVKLLLEGGADVNSEDQHSQTPLWWAASKGHGTVVKLLLEGGGAKVDSENYDGKTPLWRAASKGHGTVVKLLLERGAKVDSKDKFGWTPLS